jgi:Skp family chaperone for outer membrane proteins
MRRMFILAALAAASVAGAQDASKGKVAKIGIIDMDRIGAESQIGKGYAAQIQSLQSDIEAERTKKQAELDKIDSSIKAMQDELEKQGALLSDDAKEKKAQEIKKKAREREAYVDDGRAEMEKMVQRAQNQANALNNELQQKIKPHMEAVARQLGLDVLLDSRSAIALNGEFDISSNVIVKLDETEKASPSKPAAGASAPAAKPATAAPKPPAKK